MEILNSFISLAAILAAILAWVAKIRWAKEYIAAKDETIKAKEAQMEVLRERIIGLQELTPPKMQEYFSSMRQQLEEYIEELKSKLTEASHQIDSLQNEKAELSDTLGKLEDTLSEIESDNVEASKAVQAGKLKIELAVARQQSDSLKKQSAIFLEIQNKLLRLQKTIPMTSLGKDWRPPA